MFEQFEQQIHWKNLLLQSRTRTKGFEWTTNLIKINLIEVTQLLATRDS